MVTEEKEVLPEEKSGNPVEAKTEDLAKQLELSIEKAEDGAKKDTDGTSEENGIPAELVEKYKSMQRDYTDKTTKLADEKKQFEAEKEKLVKDSTTLTQLISNPKFIDWYNREIEKERGEVKKEESPVEVITDEILNDPKALSDYLAKRDEAIRRENDAKFKKLETERAVDRLSVDISEYANDKDNKDFYTLRDFGLIRDEDITSVALKNPTKDNIEILKLVHQTARSKYETIVNNATSQYREQEKKLIEEKKRESIDSGRGNAPSSKSVVKQTFREMLEEQAQKMGTK